MDEPEFDLRTLKEFQNHICWKYFIQVMKQRRVLVNQQIGFNLRSDGNKDAMQNYGQLRFQGGQLDSIETVLDFFQVIENEIKQEQEQEKGEENA